MQIFAVDQITLVTIIRMYYRNVECRNATA